MAENNAEDHVEHLRKTADDAARLVRNVYITFLLVGTYIAVTIGSTTDIQLLTVSPVKLPIVNVPLPIVGFYALVPWLLLLLHFNLLLQLYLLSRKLHLVDGAIETIRDEAKREEQRALLFAFPFSQMLIGRQRGRVMRALLAVIVWTTMILLPLALLVWAQIAFLPYHDETITWAQRAAVMLDLLLLWVFWSMTMAPSGRALDWWRGLAAGPARFLERTMWWRKARDERPPQAGETARGAVGLAVLSLFALVLSLLTATVPGEGLEGWVAADGLQFLRADADVKRAAKQEREARKAHDEASKARKKAEKSPEAAEKLAEARAREDAAEKALDEATERKRRAERCQRLGGNCFVLTFALFDRIGAPFHRSLRLAEAVLVAGAPSVEVMEALRGEDEAAREKELRKVAGLNLANRDLRFADLRNAFLPKANLRGANLDGVDFRGAKFFRADFRPFDVTYGGACVQNEPSEPLTISQQRKAGIEPRRENGEFCLTSLERARLDRANLSKFNLAFAQLQGANLSIARLQGANLSEARLQGANLRHARLQGADLRFARLQGARFSLARLQGANLFKAKLQGAYLRFARLQGANLRETQLQGANLRETQLQGANLSEARLQGADLREAVIGGADFRDTDLSLADLRKVDRKPLTDKEYGKLKEGLAKQVSDEKLRKRILDTLKKAIGKPDSLERTQRADSVLCDAVLPLPGNPCRSKLSVAQYDKDLVDKVLRPLGCGDNADPAIVRRLFLRAVSASWLEPKRPLGPLLAQALVDPKCKGGAALPDWKKAVLKSRAQGIRAAKKGGG